MCALSIAITTTFVNKNFLKLFATFQDLQSNGGYPSKPICARSQPGERAKLEDGDEPRLALLWHHPLYCSRRKGASTSVLFGAGDFVAVLFGVLLTMHCNDGAGDDPSLGLLLFTQMR